MIDILFRRIAAERGWTDSVQAEVLLRYAAHAGSVGTLRTFLERLPSAANDDDPFTDAVIAILRDPGLILDASFHRYCAGCRDVLTPRQAAERWCCWRVA